MFQSLRFKSRFAFLSTISIFFITQLLTATSALAAPKRGVGFKNPLVLPQATVGVAYSVDLRTLLADPGVPPYRWSAVKLPEGLSVDSANNLIKGTPTTAGTFNPALTVNDSTPEGTDLNHPATIVVLPAPPKFNISELDLGVTKEGGTLSVDITQYLTDPKSAQSFSASGLPSWLSLDSKTGKLSGSPAYTPNHSLAGPYSGITITATNSSGSSKLKAFGSVLKVIVPPKWAANPISLEDAFEDSAYSAETSKHVINTEGTAIKYTIVNMTPPPWLKISATSGTLYGTPSISGKVSVVVSLSTVIDGATYTDSTTFNLNVIHVNHPPKWLANPIVIPETTNGINISQNLSNSATDPDGDKLTFSMTGPAWAKIDPNTGVFSGSAGFGDVGLNTFTATVTDPSGESATTQIQIQINKANQPPVWNQHPTVLADANEDLKYNSINLTQYATDPDSDTMYFTKLDGPSWLTVNSNGTVSGIPGAADIGINTFHLSVSDRIASPDDVAEVKILVVHTNHLPIWTMNPIIFTVTEEKPVNQKIAQYVTDSDGDPLTFSLVSGPTWAQLSKDGTFSGTPQMTNEGDNTFQVAVADASGTLVMGTVIFKVLHVNHPPKWTQNPVVLSNATEGADYSASLTSFVTDPDLPNDVLRFSRISNQPAWLTVTQDGTVTGTPQQADGGKTFTFQVVVLDSANAQATTNVQVKVDSINHAPKWSANPIPLNDAYEDTSYSFPVKLYASDPDAGDKLSFEKVDGPNWMMVSADGIISGIPTQADVGTQISATFKVTDQGGLSATTQGVINVIHKNHPPAVGSLPTFTVKEREAAEFSLSEWVKDSDGDSLNFVLLDSAECAGWVVLTADGKLTLDHPKRINVGTHACNFKVDDGKLMSPGTLQVVVEKNPRAPIWLNDPIGTYTAKTNEGFSQSVASLAKDLDGEKITFSKIAGNEWLAISAAGVLTGTPKDADLGTQEFQLRVTNEDGLYSDGTLILNIIPGTQLDQFTVDSSGPAKTELLWVIDNSKYCDSTIKALKKYINLFYSDLDAAQVSHQNILLSSDVDKFKGLPIAETNGPKLFGSESQSLVQEFQKRVGLAGSFDICNNCRNSPIWSMFKFYEQLPTPKLADVYHKGYVTAGTPSDVLIVTHQMDHFKYYTQRLTEPLKSYTPNDFARDFVNFSMQEKQGYRVSAIAPGCPGLISSEPSLAGPSNSYNVIVQKTKGKYYVSQCNFDMETTLHDYARDVIFRAKVLGHNPFPLSKKPLDVKTMKVTVGNVPLFGNTGSSTDQWTYNAGENAVVLNWSLIDTSKLSLSDKVLIEYRISR